MRVSSNAEGPCGFTVSLFALPNICVASASKQRVSSITSGDSPNAIVSSVDGATTEIGRVFSLLASETVGSTSTGLLILCSSTKLCNSTGFLLSCSCSLT